MDREGRCWFAEFGRKAAASRVDGKIQRRKKIDKLLQTSRRAHLKQFAHEAAQIVSGGGNQVSLAELVDTGQPGAPRAACFANVSECAFDAFASQPLQLLAVLAARPPAVGMKRGLLLRRFVGPGAIVFQSGLGDVRAAGRVL